MAKLRAHFVLFGDSITQHSFADEGWGAALADLYSRKADVFLRGYSGYNTRWALSLLDKVFPKVSSSAPEVVTVFFGANDAALPDRGSQRQHVPVSEYKANLHQIVSHIKGNSETTVVVLITPPPVDEVGRRVYARATYGDKAEELPERTNEVTKLYAQACKDVAKEAGVPVIDLWSLFQQTQNWQQAYLSDGLHLTPRGSRVVFEELVNVLNCRPYLTADELPMDFPAFSEIDWKNPPSIFQAKECNTAHGSMSLGGDTD